MAIFSHKCFSGMSKILPVASIEKDFECVAVEFSNCIVISTNRSLSGCFKTFISKHDETLNFYQNDKKIIIPGDFNVDFLKRSNQSSNFKRIKKRINCFGLSYKINSSTRISKETSTCIDNIITDMTNSQALCIESGISDYMAQFIEFTID